MKKRKTKGSSVLIVIAIFGILSILGTSMLAATTASYRLRIEESNRMKNLYAAESGIDKAYIMMTEVIQDALNSGIRGVSDAIDDIVKIQGADEQRKEINKVFKSSYKDYLVNNMVQKFKNPSGQWINIDIGNGENALIECSMIKLHEEEDSDRRVQLKSIYRSPSTGKERIVSVSYVIEIPKDYRVETSRGETISNLIKYTLAADGDLSIIDSAKVNVDGETWVQGTMAKEGTNGESAQVLLDEKYKGGIEVINSNVKFYGDVSTASNINVRRGKLEFLSSNKDEDGKIIPNNIYTENIFLGNINNLNEASEIEFNAGTSNVYLANDLVIGASDAKVYIDKFYGFNDISTDVSTEALAQLNNSAIRGSSSIIINSDYWPYKDKNQINATGELKVNTEAYIMGSAYIKTEHPYQTGESLAIKGNYKVYTEKANGYQYEYINPLYLVTMDAAGKKLTLKDKVEFFVDNSKGDKVRTDGISLPLNTKSIGAYISEGEVKNNNILIESQTTDAFEYKKQYVQSVYNMKDGKYIEDTKVGLNSIQDDFLKGYAQKTIGNEIYWEGVDYLIDKRKNVIELEDITVILNNDFEKEINISDTEESLGNAVISLGSTYLTTVSNAPDAEGKKRRYIIVTAGDINFSSNYDFNGSIFSNGNIVIKDTSATIGMTPLTVEELTKEKNLGVLDMIFTLGKRSEGNLVIKALDLVNKERWRLIK